MGNNQSRSGAPQGPTPQAAHSHHAPAHRKEPRRRESVQAIQSGGLAVASSGKSAPAAPTPSLTSAEYKAHSSGGGGGSARVTLPNRPASVQSGRSVHQRDASTPPHLKPADSVSEESSSRMGNEQSKHTTTSPSPRRGGEAKGAAATGEHRHVQQPSSDLRVGPVDVPASREAERAEGAEDSPISPSQAYSLPPTSQFTRPPRLPLPIEEEDYTPGSPIISPADLSDPIGPIDEETSPARTRSMLSGTTVDDEEPEDDSQAGGLVGESIGPAVPTVIEWRGDGEKVYVTGTFAAWDRKYRLHKDGPSKHKDALSACINLQPGTHHLKFIVDGDMRLCTELPTAVDFTNILVNYIEVSPDDRPHPLAAGKAGDGASAVPPASSGPIDIKPLPGQAGGASTTIGAPPKKPAYKFPPDLRPPLALPAEFIRELERPSSKQEQAAREKPTPPPKTPSATAHKATRIPTKYYHNVVPQFLLDLDTPDGSTVQRQATAVSETLPAPPTLPSFLSKSVLNGTMPHKDDASVLMLPNHTVLNHLATSSIRQGVLATSATTRYKQKFLTTIIYKPTSGVGD